MAYYDNRTYVGAPYNFVPFSKNVLPYPEGIAPAHDAVHIKTKEGTAEELISGEIRYMLKAVTPVFVGSGDKSKGGVEGFYRNADGNYTIPGSSVRGLIRANVQALSLSSFTDDVDDYKLMFRQVAYGSEKGRYNDILGNKPVTIPVGGEQKTISVLKNVRAGYVKNVNGNYYIFDTVIDQIEESLEKMNYFVLSERQIWNAYRRAGGKEKNFEYDFFFRNGKSILQHNVNARGYEFNEIQDKNGRTHYKWLRSGDFDPKSRDVLNPDYAPYALPCSYEAKQRKVTAVGSPGKYKNNGYAVSSGKMVEKKAIYIIPEMDPSKSARYDGVSLPIEIPKDSVKAFKIDLSKRETVLKTFGGAEHFDLPKEGETKPLFYIQIGSTLYFGFTPRLRLFYDQTIKAGMSFEQKRNGLDYAKAMFGFISDSGSYKSRVSFSDAPAVGTPGTAGQADMILGEPKPTSCLDYLQPENGRGVSYNTNGFLLRGMKQYWLRNEIYEQAIDSAKKDKDFVSHLLPLEKGTEFSGKVRFHNLKKEELGLLLWAIRLQEKSEMNIGKGKAFGYGVIKPSITCVTVLQNEKLTDLSSLCLNPWKDLDSDEMQEYIEAFRNRLSLFLKKEPEKDVSIRTLFLMKDGERKPDPNKIRMMSIDAREYQSRKDPLDTADRVMGENFGGKVTAEPQKKAFQNRETVAFDYAAELKKKEEAERIAREKQDAAARKKKGLAVGDVFEAVIKQPSKTKITFKIEEEKIDDKFIFDNILFEVTKKTINEVLAKGTPVEVRLKEKEGDTLIWECVRKL